MTRVKERGNRSGEGGGAVKKTNLKSWFLSTAQEKKSVSDSH